MRFSLAGFALLSVLAVACGGTVSNSGDNDKADSGPAPDNDTNPDASTSDASDSSRLAAGIYGGLGVQVTVASDGSATFQFDCSKGASGPITVTSTGSTGPVFSVTGTYTQDEGIELPDAGPPAAQTAFYTGHVFGNTITFSYSLDGTTSSGEFSATLGVAPDMAFCG